MIEFLQSLMSALESEILVAMLVCAGTAILVSFWVPGVLLPIAASSGALLDAVPAAATVTLGALMGSMIIFTTTRFFAADRIPARVEAILRRHEERFRSQGAWFVFVLRLVGAPHFLVSSGSAVMPIRGWSFALATLLGLFPAIMLAAIAGSSLTN